MTKSQARQRLESLKKEINHHQVLDREEISQEAFDPYPLHFFRFVLN